MSFFFRRLVPFSIAAAVLVACGGGDAVTDAATPLPTVDTPALDPLVLAVSEPTYPPGSDDLLAFKTLNTERLRCGFGLLAQDQQLDAAARAHREYMALNNVLSHTEVHGSPGFTGFDPFARAVSAGYQAVGVSEGLIPSHGGEASMRGLLSAPYHAISMLSGWKDIGLSFADGMLVNVYGTKGLMQSSDGIRTYPCAGTVGTGSSSTRETPSPFSNFDEVWGQPILIMSPANFQLLSVQINSSNTTTPVKVVYGKGHTEDPHFRCNGVWTCIIPEPLQPSTTYEVKLTWLDNGNSGGRTFSFQTGTY